MSIQIRTSPAPSPRVKSSKASSLADSFDALAALKPGEWFIVPGTEAKTPGQTSGIRRALAKFVEGAGHDRSGIAIHHTQNDRGVLVRRAGESAVQAADMIARLPANGSALPGEPTAAPARHSVLNNGDIPLTKPRSRTPEPDSPPPTLIPVTPSRLDGALKAVKLTRNHNPGA